MVSFEQLCCFNKYSASSLDQTKDIGSSQAKRRPRVAAFAIVKVRLAERALTVMAGHAALRARVGEMLRREGGTHLSSLRRATPRDRVAAIAIKTLTRAVIGMAEADAVGACVR